MKTLIKHSQLTPIWVLADEGESWIRLFRAGTLVYEGEPIDIDEKELDLIADETNRLIANCEKYAAEAGDDVTAWKPPIMAEHKSEGGKTYGRVTQVKRKGDELFGLVQWKASTWKQVLAEEIEFVSPHVVGGYQDSKGEKYARILWETSLTTHPKLKDIGRVQDTLSVRLSDNTTVVLAEHEEEQMEEMIEKLMATLEALPGQVAEAVVAAQMGEGEDVEAMDDEEEVAASEDVEASDEVEASDTGGTELADRFEKLEASQVKLAEALTSISKSTAKLLTDEPGGDAGKPKGSASTVEAKFKQARKNGMSAAEAAIAARK